MDEPPGSVRLKLQAVTDAGEDGAFFLTLPMLLFDRSGLAAGQLVVVRHRPYGLEFAAGDTRQAFFIVLTDDWHRELQPHAVLL